MGYNSDSRKVVGDSVLQSAILNWAPVLGYFIQSIRDEAWEEEAQIWYGIDDKAAKMAPFFSPIVEADFQDFIRRKQAELESAKGIEAFRHIFCGDLKKRWVYKNSTSGERVSGCGFQPEWVRLDTPESINPQHFVDNDGNQLGANDNISSTDCLSGMDFPGQALLFTAYPEPFDEDRVFSDYLLEGVELFEAQTTLYGTIHNEDNHGCFSASDFFNLSS